MIEIQFIYELDCIGAIVRYDGDIIYRTELYKTYSEVLDIVGIILDRKHK